MTTFNGKILEELDLNAFKRGTLTEIWLHVISNGIGEPVRIPIIVGRGVDEGPTVGLMAALHGNELNGIPVIQRLFRELDPQRLRGNLIGVLVTNLPGLLLEQRYFNDGTDLNRIAPGLANGSRSEVYINRVIEKILIHFDYLIDLHTASFGRVNSYYIRADMSDPYSNRMARLQHPDIILHNPPNDNTLRGTAASVSIKSITVELKDPHLFQFDVIKESLAGIRNVLYDLEMLEGKLVCPREFTLLCEHSYWLYTDEGGILQVYPKITDPVRKGQLIAEVRDVFGNPIRKYFAPEDGIVIGKSINPVNQTGSRILHLGVHPRQIPCVAPGERRV